MVSVESYLCSTYSSRIAQTAADPNPPCTWFAPQVRMMLHAARPSAVHPDSQQVVQAPQRRRRRERSRKSGLNLKYFRRRAHVLISLPRPARSSSLESQLNFRLLKYIAFRDPKAMWRGDLANALVAQNLCSDVPPTVRRGRISMLSVVAGEVAAVIVMLEVVAIEAVDHVKAVDMLEMVVYPIAGSAVATVATVAVAMVASARRQRRRQLQMHGMAALAWEGESNRSCSGGVGNADANLQQQCIEVAVEVQVAVATVATVVVVVEVEVR
eukprot:6185334-Pleurochrysis_carterae.AAC.2